MNAPRAGVHGLLLSAALLGAPMLASASHIGEALATDQQLVSANNQFLAALSQWEKLSPSLKASNLAGLVQLAQSRQQVMIALVQTDAKVAAARMLPKSLRARIPAQAAAYVEDDVHVQGSSFINVADNFASGISHATFKIVGNAGSTPQSVYLADPTGTERDLHKLAGKKLTFDAMRVGTYLVLLDKKKVQSQDLQAAGSTTTSTSTSSLQAAGTVVQGDQKTLSILVNFTDKALACTAADVSNRVTGTLGATVNNIYKDSSRGLVSFSGTAVGPFNINYSSTGACDYSGWGAAAEAAAQAARIDPALYTRVNYVTPSNSTCGWSGLAYMPGRQSWIQACGSTGVYAHEFGHNLSLHHAGTPTAEYGDVSDPMGGAQAIGHNGANRVMAGWQPSGTVQDVASGGLYSVSTVSNNTIVSTPQVLRMAKPDTAETYYISLREAMAYDTPLSSTFVNTISVHRATGTLPTKTYLMQVLAAGQSFNDATNGITITNQGVTSNVATVGVTMAGAVCARYAPSVSLTPSSQTALPGGTINYTMTVQNNNTAACGTSTFSLSQVVPTGFTGSLSATSLALGAASSGSVNWAATSGSGTVNGTYGLDATATDTGATTSKSSNHASYIVYNDTLPPVVSFSNPASGAMLTGNKPFSIAVTASDASGIQSVDIYVDTVLLAHDTGTPYTASWNLRKATKGSHTIKAIATDNAGQVTETSVNVTLN
jgi:hypothetical protein